MLQRKLYFSREALYRRIALLKSQGKHYTVQKGENEDNQKWYILYWED